MGALCLSGASPAMLPFPCASSLWAAVVKGPFSRISMAGLMIHVGATLDRQKYKENMALPEPPEMCLKCTDTFSVTTGIY